MGYRLGSALALLGVLLLIVFLVTMTIQQEDVRTLLAGAGLAALGLALRRRNRPPRSPESLRFRALRDLFGGRPEEDEVD